MSLLKTIKAQLGLSNTPANNFTITAEADNGTLKLARGNAGATTQDILTVDASGKVVFPQNAQTWQDVSASRVLGTVYTNTTSQPIKIAVCYTTSNTSQYLILYVGSTMVSRFGDATVSSISATVYGEVPAGATYQVQSNAPTRGFWVELR